LGGKGKQDQLLHTDGFAEGVNIWSLAEGKIMPAPQWQYAKGLVRSIEKLPGNMRWVPLRGEGQYVDIPILVEGGDLNLKDLNLWVKKIGAPGDLLVSIHSDNGGLPDELITEAEFCLDAVHVEELISRWVSVSVGSSVLLSNNSTYHLLINAEQAGSTASHWLLGVDKEEFAANISSDGASWDNAEFSPYFRLSEESIQRKWSFFNYAQGFYAVDQRVDGMASSLWINGDRGKATGSTSTSIVDANKNWEVDVWEGAWVKIIKGTGRGQSCRIITNGSDSLEVEGWRIIPDASSEYVICGTEIWQDISPISGDMIDGVVLDTCVINDQVIFAQGDSANILKMRWNADAAPPVHEFDDDGTNKADHVHCFQDRENGLRLWKALKDNAELSSAVPANWGTAHSFGASIFIGSNDSQITSMFEHDGSLRVFKSDGLYEVFSDNTIQKIVSDLGHVTSDMNGGLTLSRRKDLYFRWGKNKIYFAEGGVRNNDVVEIRFGVGSKGKVNEIIAIIGHPKGFLTANKSGAESSSTVNLYMRENDCWHEVFRAPENGKGIDNIFWQGCEGGGTRLWMSYGGEMIFIDWPLNESYPSQDVELRFQHEACMVTGNIDLGTARIPKMFRELTLITENLRAGTEIHVDYQADSEIGSEAWSRAGIMYRSAEDNLNLKLGGKKQIRFRYRLITNNSLRAPIILASVLEAFVRAPLKYQWSVKVKLSNSWAGLDGVPAAGDRADDLICWLKESAEEAKSLTMRSIWTGMDRKMVVVDPPRIAKEYKNDISGAWGGSLKLKIKEF
jgi:hypothetical protein